ncbi:MAG: hypothetical protein WCK10_02620 [Candidatus Staskawiczbacteria bacterium]
MQVDSADYITYKGEPFQVEEGTGIHQNIELQLKNWFLRLFTIERILLGIVVVLLLSVLLVVIFRKKIN